MARTLKAGVQVVSAPQLFPTPQPLAEQLAELADLESGHRVLEPSAGTGMLLDVARRSVDGSLDVVAVEINCQLAQGIARRFPGVTVINADFLDMAGATPNAKFDRILMNPPFVNGADIRHIEHARTLLKPGGRLVAICADGPRQRERLQPIASEWRSLPAGTFKESGTMVNAALLVIDG
jgi:phospholipid N-methyltransferase